MTETKSETKPESKDGGAAKALTPAAERALAEAAARRAERDRLERGRGDKSPPEIAGRGGLDPVRYGDWEVKGVASDF